MRRAFLLAALALVAAPAAAAPKPTTKAAAKPTTPSDAQLKQARDVLSLFVSAFNSTEVPQPTKEGLFLCLYGNPLGKIARGHAAAMAASKAPAGNPTQKLAVLAGLCNAPWPTSAADKPAGR